ncbi:hypothetical protein [Hoylesella saccharolytica]|uniref:hypothetical protein n=1 Tax=Hoylesella saccharolytica TaxID=633701 RepID=UPI0028EABBA2|nr:hypothetical protein [Hoylesella saccharolytica]
MNGRMDDKGMMIKDEERAKKYLLNNQEATFWFSIAYKWACKRIGFGLQKHRFYNPKA